MADLNRPQHQVAEAVAEALEADENFRKVVLYKGTTFSLIHAYIETPTAISRLRIEVHPETN